MPKRFTDEHALDYSSPPLYDEYDNDHFEVEFDIEYVYDDLFDSKGEKIEESKLLTDELDLPRSIDFLPSHEYDSFLLEDFSSMINIFNDSSEDFLENLFATNHQSSNPTFSSHPELNSPEVKDDIFDLEGGNVIIEKLLDFDSSKDLHPTHNVNPLSGCTTSSSPNHLLEEFANEFALITFPPRNDDLPFDIESDLKDIEDLLDNDLIMKMDSILYDSIDQSNLADLNNNLADIMPKRFTDEHALDYSSPPLYDEYDNDHFEVEFDIEYVYDDLFDSKGEKIEEIIDTTKAQQIALNDALLDPTNRIEIGKCNHQLSSPLKPNEPTLQATVSIHHTSLHFKMNGKSHTLNLENFRDMLQICPKLPGQKFKDPPFEEEILSFIRDLGYTKDIKIGSLRKVVERLLKKAVDQFLKETSSSVPKGSCKVGKTVNSGGVLFTGGKFDSTKVINLSLGFGEFAPL
nr:hypothetical protein [Tanacetum cinerariifolium]